ncbi:APC family permease [Paenibacillus glycanilyticus]|uniref:Amino acid permease-associated protein n=1 Tax=Paenibacillus glycanilyticus TaxID=126569 RepID=A0ABQ6GI97_9BACL|nr:APC family permease [Paenibacillus glycanilyticus]GLX70666.1 amino acid permease-associated protein [Paenibacillus glycanilyticus]
MQATLKRTLGLWSIVMLGLGYMAPMALFDTFGIVSGSTDGHVPVAYAIALVAMLFTAFSYGRMVKVFPSAGSAYTYTQKTMNPHLGFLVGWSSLLDYLLLPMVNALLSQIYLSAIFPEVPPWIWVVAFVLIITCANIWSLTSIAKFNTLLVLYQVLIVVIFIILAVRELMNGEGYGSVLASGPLYNSDMRISSLVIGATVLCFSFLGFDAVTTYSEETPNPSSTIPKAIFLTALIGGLLFIIGSYFAQALFPDVTSFNDPDAASPEIALYVGGKIFQLFFLAASLASTVASGLSSHASVSRLLYVMGRDNVLPSKLFGYVHPRLRTPVLNIIIVGLLAMTAVFFNLETASSFISFGALIAFTFVNLSVIVHYAWRKKMYSTVTGFFSHIVIPTIGAVFVFILWFNLERNSFMLGLSWAALGIIYLLFVTKGFRVRPGNIQFEEAGESPRIDVQAK